MGDEYHYILREHFRNNRDLLIPKYYLLYRHNNVKFQQNSEF